MLKLTIIFWIGLIAWNWHTSLAESEDSNHSDRALQDTAIQRSKFCLSVLEPLLTRFAELQDQRSHREGVIPKGTAPTLDRMEGQQTKTDNQLLAMLTRIDAKLTNIELSVKPIPKGFEQIENRTFYINHYDEYTFADANAHCRSVGRYLASIKNKEELNNLKSGLESLSNYWLATNDQAVEGHFVSSVTNKTAPFLTWKQGQPSDKDHTKNCVVLNNGLMYNADCKRKMHTICQSDNDI